MVEGLAQGIVVGVVARAARAHLADLGIAAEARSGGEVAELQHPDVQVQRPGDARHVLAPRLGAAGLPGGDGGLGLADLFRQPCLGLPGGLAGLADALADAHGRTLAKRSIVVQ